MTQTTDQIVLTPGLYDIPADLYHADPVPSGSLSASGAKLLLPPSCPAKFRYQLENPVASTKEMEFGTVAHKIVLGEGPELVVIDAPNWRGAKTQAQADEARGAGALPLLSGQYQQIQDMVRALRTNRLAAALFNADYGAPEQSLFWVDGPSGIWRRARLDWLPTPDGARLLVADYKTCASAAPDDLQRAMHRLRYHQQAAWYLDGVRSIFNDCECAFLFVCQEKEPPYLVTVVELDAIALRAGRDANREAIDIYQQCKTTGNWPGYSDDIYQLGLPAWAENRYLRETT